MPFNNEDFYDNDYGENKVNEIFKIFHKDKRMAIFLIDDKHYESDIRLMSSFNGSGITSATTTTDVNITTGTKLSKSVLGTSFTLTGTTINTLFGTTTSQLSTTITVIGRDSGARITIPVNIIKVNNL